MKSSKKTKKNYLLFGGLFVVILTLIIVLGIVMSNSKDGAKFKREYEAYNGEKNSRGTEYKTLKIKKNNKVKYSTTDEALDILKDGTGLIYFGFPNCPWCRMMLPILLETVECSCVDKLLYVDMTDKRDEFKVEDGEAKKTKDASESYYKLLERLENELDDYVITDDDGIEYSTGEKRMYVPLVIAVKSGEVVGIYDGIDLDEGQLPSDELKESQRSEIEVIFSNMISEMTKTDDKYVCDEHC
ncbi:MAG TPA: hypothetical protein DCY94_01355 [Firmicutes bacterium]|nr:hypothetical protein [Bacillota bacterium]